MNKEEFIFAMSVLTHQARAPPVCMQSHRAQEDLESQELCLRLWRERGFDKARDRNLAKFTPSLLRCANACTAAAHTCSNYETIKQFGRFPQRNAALGRMNTKKEAKFLEALAQQHART